VTIADPAAFGLGIPFSGEATRDAGALEEVARQAADGRLRVTVVETYPLEEASAAQESVATGHGRGKVVLLVD
jgi:NADPH:quinone reductase-like Zn-dependent oxidoreductase